MEAETCGGCRFFAPFWGGAHGLCKRRSPREAGGACAEALAWPTVLPGWGACGEYERRGRKGPGKEER